MPIKRIRRTRKVGGFSMGDIMEKITPSNLFTGAPDFSAENMELVMEKAKAAGNSGIYALGIASATYLAFKGVRSVWKWYNNSDKYLQKTVDEMEAMIMEISKLSIDQFMDKTRISDIVSRLNIIVKNISNVVKNFNNIQESFKAERMDEMTLNLSLVTYDDIHRIYLGVTDLRLFFIQLKEILDIDGIEMHRIIEKYKEGLVRIQNIYKMIMIMKLNNKQVIEIIEKLEEK